MRGSGKSNYIHKQRLFIIHGKFDLNPFTIINIKFQIILELFPTNFNLKHQKRKKNFNYNTIFDIEIVNMGTFCKSCGGW